VAARQIVLPVGARAKLRDEGLVVLWTVLTLGIWTLVWYYRINREMRDFGRSHGDERLANSNPVLSILAVTLGVLLLVPPLVSYWKTTGRIRRMQGLCNVPLTQGWVIALLWLFGFFALAAIPPYVQSGLNQVWKLYPAADDPQMRLPEGTQPLAEPAPAGAPAPQGPPPDPADRLD
jgi:hypothetical protein